MMKEVIEMKNREFQDDLDFGEVSVSSAPILTNISIGIDS